MIMQHLVNLLTKAYNQILIKERISEIKGKEGIFTSCFLISIVLKLIILYTIFYI
jgi:hypothetical protein